MLVTNTSSKLVLFRTGKGMTGPRSQLSSSLGSLLLLAPKSALRAASFAFPGH